MGYILYMSILASVVDIHNYLKVKRCMPYVIYMKTYSYLDKYLFTYFDKFIKKSLL